MVDQWQFPDEQTLEETVWSHLGSLFSLNVLSRQFIIQNQICDLLAIDGRGQLVILELKNVEDRYILPQLTRYYHAVVQEQPFAERVDYTLPVRLVAIAPTFHAHTLIDREYSRLDVELWTFRLIADGDSLWLELKQWESDQTPQVKVPDAIRPFMVAIGDDAPPPVPLPPPLPRSLQQLMEPLSSEQQAYVLRLRERILSFDERMIELGRTTTTQYGLRKGEKDVYKTKLCAEFISFHVGGPYLRLMLWLPYPKREFGAPGRSYKKERVKGFTWVEINHKQRWQPDSDLSLLFYMGKGRSRYSYQYSLADYTQVYRNLCGSDRVLQSAEDVVDLALEEWKGQIA